MLITFDTVEIGHDVWALTANGEYCYDDHDQLVTFTDAVVAAETLDAMNNA